jgi:hypothetical protein
MLDRTRQDIMPRATVESVVAHRNRTLALYEQAHAALAIAETELDKAHASCYGLAQPENRFNYHSREEKVAFLKPFRLEKRDAYMATARRIVDTEVWSHIIGITDLERLMDKQAKEELHKQLIENPPEITVENVQATLQQFCLDAGTIFKRGIANCFTKLERRFRSHDGWKVGSRIVLTYMFDHMGWWNHSRDMESVLLDVERTFMVLDGRKVPPSYVGIVGQLRNHRTGGHGPRQSFVENEFFRVRAFKNGNCHVWFKRDDLVDKVNQLLGEYYGAPIPEEREPEEDTGLHRPKTSLAKNFGFFPTPDDAADRMLETCPLYREKDQPKVVALEPSAGTGNLARRLVAKGAIVDCVEVQPALASQLADAKIYRKVLPCDFMQLPANPVYDLVAMNPPFDLERDIDHVMHALEFLKPTGCLVAIMSASTEFRETKKSVAFRALIEKMHGQFSDLPAGSFSSVGTNVNTITLKVFKDGRTFWR